jgi:hypothetical protein
MLISSLELDRTLSVIKRGTFGIARAPRRRQFPLLLERRDIGGDIRRLIPTELHVRHLRVWIEQEER